MADEQLTPDRDDTEDLGMDFAVEMTSNVEYLSACFYAISSVSELDIYQEPGKSIKNRILNRCLKIIDLCVLEMYEELFDPSKDEE